MDTVAELVHPISGNNRIMNIMKKTASTTLMTLIATLLVVTAGPLSAVPFDSGSDGSYGAIDVTNSMTLDIPSNGVFNCTTIAVRNGTTLYFRTNALNTPVYLLAQGDVVIEGSASIEVNGQDVNGSVPGPGGPGGFAGGFGEFQGYPAGDGLGPGGGTQSNGYNAASAVPSNTGNTNVYGNTLCVPLVGGSGGAGNSGGAGGVGGGGGGGGAILIASNTRITVRGTIYAYGGPGGNGNHGSGGMIHLVAPIVDGNRNGQRGDGINFYVVNTGDASGGRVRIDTLNRLAWRNLVFSGKWTVGTQMFTGLGDPRRLDIIEAAGRSIPLGTADRVVINLPLGSDTNQIVRVRASGFTNDVPITVAVIPENGGSTRYDAVIPATGGNPSTNAVNVVVPVDSVTYVQVWSK